MVKRANCQSLIEKEPALLCLLVMKNEVKHSPIKTSNIWKLDLGATSHITNFDDLTDYSPIKNSFIQTADGQHLKVAGIRTFRGEHFVNGLWRQIQLHETLYVPELQFKLISIS